MQIPVFVINLNRSEGRRREVSNILNELGIEFTIIRAIDGQNADPQILKRHYSPDASIKLHGRNLHDNEIACSLSHLSIYKMMVRENIECAVILEDDVFLKDSFKSLILEAPNIIKREWDIINLYSNAKDVAFGEPIFGSHKFSKFKYDCNGTVAYIIKITGAIKLIQHAYPIRYAADGLTGRFREFDVKMLGISPQVVGVRCVPSDIIIEGFWDTTKPISD